MDGLNNLLYLYENVISKNVKNKKKVYYFERFKMMNIYEAYKIIESNRIKNINYNIFLISEPKYRIVMSLNIVDKLVNHYVSKYYLEPRLSKYLIDNNVATRVGMGTDYAIKKIKRYIELNKKYDRFYILKLDISKYFYSIYHEILLKMLKDKLSEKEYFIVKDILNTTNNPEINKRIKKIKEKYNIDEINNIPYYEYGKGLPIGNMTSQFLSIFYLYELDHYIVHDLHIKYYIRYMDDFILIHNDIDVLKNALEKIKDILEQKYKLNINLKKTKITNSKNGFVFLGYNFKVINKKTIIKINNNALKKAKNNIKKRHYEYVTNKIDFNQAFCTYMTYRNSYKYASTMKLRDYLDKKWL